MTTSMEAPVLSVRNLTVDVRLRSGGRASVVDDVSFDMLPGGTLGLVGESGSGKSMTSLAIMGLLPRAARVAGGSIDFDGVDLVGLGASQLQGLRGSQLSMVLQDPMTALDPCYTIGSQVASPIRRHRGLEGAALADAVVAALEQVQLASIDGRLKQYPHQLSGGMRQRVTSAIALAGKPRVLIADEPTTALDVTTQAKYLELLAMLQDESGFSLLLVTHDLHIVKQVCTRVVVMYSGQVVEQGSVEEVFSHPQHPYTSALLSAVPVLGFKGELETIEGQAPEVGSEVLGCRFAARCRFARQRCREARPELTEREGDQAARCFGTEPGGWIETA